MFCAVLDNPVQRGCYRLDNPIAVAAPVPVEPVVPARAGGGATIHYLDLPRHWRFQSQATLVLLGEALVRFEPHQQVKPAPILFHAKYASSGEIRLQTSTKWDFWDQGEDDDTLAILLAMRYFHDV